MNNHDLLAMAKIGIIFESAKKMVEQLIFLNVFI